jgi:glycosyltransferase involved in cell wall biosynthesis
LIDDGRTGFLVDSVEEMAEAIPAAANLDPESCRKEAEARFSSEHMIANYFRLYEEIKTGTPQRSEAISILEAA